MLTGEYAHNHRVLGNHWPDGGFYRFRPQNSLPVWLQHAGYLTAHVGKFLNGYGKRNRREVPPAGTSGTRRSTRRRTATGTTRSTRTGSSCTTATRVRDYRTDVDTRTAVGIIKRHAKDNVDRGKPLYLQVDYLAPHSGYPVALDDPPRMPTPEPAPRHRDRYAFAPLPTPPNYNEADVKDKPIGIRRRAPHRAVRALRDHRGLPAAARVAALGRRGRRRDRQRAPPHRRAEQHVHLLQLRQRLLPGRAPHPERQGAALRGVDPAAAARPRAGDRAAHRARPARRQRRPRADDRRHRAREAGADPGRRLAAAAAEDAATGT